MPDDKTHGRQVADLICSLCGWHVIVWQEPDGPGIAAQPTDLSGPASALSQHIRDEHDVHARP